MAVRKIKNSWWIDFRAGYIRYRKRSPENTQAGAKAYEATLRGKLSRGESIEQSKTQELSFAEFAGKWFEEYVVSNNKPSEQRTKKYILRSLVPFFGKTILTQISSHHIEQYKSYVLKKGLSKKTVNNHLTVLRKCLVTAYEWYELEGVPPRFNWLKPPPPKINYLSPEEIEQLLTETEGVVHDMLLIALHTGMRQGEIRGLQWSSIDWEAKTIIVRHSRCDYTKELASPKSNRERYVPMTEEVCWILLKRKRKEGYVFLDEDGKPFNNQRLALRLKNIRKKEGLRKFGWHTLRHTFASQLVMKGASLASIQALLGHSTITMTMKYAHLAPSTLRAAIDLLSPQKAGFGQPVGNQKMPTVKKPYAQ
jgi:integrase